MRKLPGWESVGGKPLVHHAERAARFSVRKLLVKIRNLRCQQQAFVDNDSGRKRWNVEELFFVDLRFRDFLLRAPPHHIQLALQLILRHSRRAADEYLL